MGRAQGRELLVLRGHAGGVTCLGFTADSRRLVSGDKEQFVKVWDVTHPPRDGAFQVTTRGTLGEWVANLAFDPDGQTLRVVDDRKTEPRFRIRQWDVDHGRLVAENPLSPWAAGPRPCPTTSASAADGRWLAAADLGRNRGPGRLPRRQRRRRPAPSAPARRTSSRWHWRPTAVWSLTLHGEPAPADDASAWNWAWRRSRERSGRASSCHRAGSSPACASAPTADCLAGAEENVPGKANSPATQRPRDIVFWEAPTGRERRRLPAAELDLRPCLAFSPDGQRLAMVDLGGAVRVWDLETGRLAFPASRRRRPA